MENIIVANVHQTKKKAATPTKRRKKNPIKVVYISNPKKFNTSATQFKALVQELTGQDSDPAKFVDPDYDDDDVQGRRRHHQTDDIAGSKIYSDDDDHHHQVFSLEDPTSATAESPPDLLPPPSPLPPPLAPLLFAEPFDHRDDSYHHHQTFDDNLSGFLFSEFFHLDLLRGVDAM